MLKPADALEVEQQLPPDGVNHGSVVAERDTRAGTHKPSLKQWIRHPCHCLHGQNGVAYARRGDIFLTQGAQRAQLPQILKCIALLLRNQFSSLPPLQLVSANLQNPQYVLTAIAGHS